MSPAINLTMADDNERFLLWVRTVTIKTIQCMEQAEQDVKVWRLPYSTGLAFTNNPAPSPGLPYWNLLNIPLLVKGLEGSLDPQYRRTRILGDAGVEACFEHVFFDEELPGGSNRVTFWETTNYPDEDLTPLKSPRSPPFGDGWIDMLYPWSSGRTAFVLHFIVRMAHKIGKGSPNIFKGDFPWHPLIAMLCYAALRKAFQPPNRGQHHMLSHWIRYSVLPKHPIVGMLALHFLDDLPQVPDTILTLPLGFRVGEPELYRLMACVSFLTEDEIARWQTDPTLGVHLDWDAEPGRPTKFALENFLHYLSRFSNSSLVGPTGFGTPRLLYAAGARSFSTIAAFESKTAFVEAIKSTPYFQKVNQSGLANFPDLLVQEGFWTNVYQDSVDALELNQVRAQQIVIDLKRYVAGSGISSIDLRDQKQRMQDIRNVTGLDVDLILGQIDDYTCEDCKSIFSPSAYLTELIRFLPPKARTALLHRRPDLEGLLLTCANTHVTLPYLDIANEIMAEKIWQQYQVALGETPAPFRAFNTDEDADSEDLRGTPTNQLPTLSRLQSVYTLPPLFVSTEPDSQLQWTPSVRLPSVPLTSLPCDIGTREMQLLMDAFKVSRDDLLSTFRDPHNAPLAKSLASAKLVSSPEDWLDADALDATDLRRGQSEAIHRAWTAEYLGLLPAEYLAVTREGFWSLDFWNLQAVEALGKIVPGTNLDKALRPLPPTYLLWGYPTEDAMAEIYSLEHGFIGRSGLTYEEYTALVKTHSIGRYDQVQSGNQLFKDNPYPFHTPFDVQYELQFGEGEDVEAVFNGIQSFVRLKRRTGLSVVDLDAVLTIWEGYDAAQGRIRPELLVKLTALKEMSNTAGIGFSLLLLLWSDLPITDDVSLIKELFGNRNVQKIDAEFAEWIKKTFLDKGEESGDGGVGEVNLEPLSRHVAAIAAALGLSQAGLLAVGEVAALDLTTEPTARSNTDGGVGSTAIPEHALLSPANLSSLARLVVLGRCFDVAPNQLKLLLELFPDVIFEVPTKLQEREKTAGILHKIPQKTLRCLRQWKRISDGGLPIDQVHALVQSADEGGQDDASTSPATNDDVVKQCLDISSQFLGLQERFPSTIDPAVSLSHLEGLLPHVVPQSAASQILAVIQGNSTSLELGNDPFGIKAELASYPNTLTPTEKATRLYQYLLAFVLAEEKMAILSKVLMDSTKAKDAEMLEFGLEMTAGAGETAQTRLECLTEAFNSTLAGIQAEQSRKGFFNPESTGQYSFRFSSVQTGDVYIDDLPVAWARESIKVETKLISLSAEKMYRLGLPSSDKVELLFWVRGTPRIVDGGSRNIFLPLATVEAFGATIASLERLFGPINTLSLVIDEVRFWKWHGEQRLASTPGPTPRSVHVAAEVDAGNSLMPWGSRSEPVNFARFTMSSIEQLCEYASVKKLVTAPSTSGSGSGEATVLLNEAGVLQVLKAGTQGRLFTISSQVSKLIEADIGAGVVEILLRIYGGLDPRRSVAWEQSWADDTIDDVVTGPKSDICNEYTMLQLLRAISLLDKFQVNNTQALKTILAVARPVSDELSWTESTVMAISLGQLLRTRMDSDTWSKTVLPVSDELRRQRRDAMVALLLRDEEFRTTGYIDAESLFEYFYLDVQMDTSLQTSRIVQAISTVHTFVQRAFLGLETTGTDDEGNPIYFNDLDRTKWTWLSRYRIWEANRKVLAYPENYITAASLDQKTNIFRELEAALDKKPLSPAALREATHEYLHALSALSHLDYMAYDFSTRPAVATTPGADADPDAVVFNKVRMFARTRQQPWRFFYRERDYYYGWSAWQLVEMDVPIALTGDKSANGSWLVPYEDRHGRRLVFVPGVAKAFLTDPEDIAAGSAAGESGSPIGFEVKLHWSELINGQWKPIKSFEQSTIRIELSGVNVGEVMTRLFFTTEPIKDEEKVTITVWGDAAVTISENGGFETKSTKYTRFGTWTVFLDQMVTTFKLQQDLSTGIFGRTSSTVPQVTFNTLALSQDTFSVIPSHLEPENAIDGVMVRITKTSPIGVGPLITIAEDEDHVVEESMSVPSIGIWLGRSAKRQKQDDLAVTFGMVSDPDLGGVQVSEFGGLTSVEEPEGAYDFDMYSRPYSMYYWEMGLFIPMLAAEKFLQNQQFDDALAAIQAVFDPRSPSAGTGGAAKQQAHWKFRPFRAVAETSPQTLVESFRTFKPTGRHLEVWSDRPFQAHVFARARIQTYMSWVVMKYAEVFLAYGDFYFRQDTMESIPLAIQCYVEATQALGKRVPLFPRPKKPASTLRDIRAGSDTTGVDFILEIMKELVSAPGADEYGNEERESWLGAKTLASTYFCMPQNPKLGQIRDSIEDRLFKIRHSMDINGNLRTLALFAPAINPSLIISALAGGSLQLSNVLSELDAPLVNVRFANLVAKAKDVCKFNLQNLGRLMLGNLEARDANELANIVARQNRETEGLKLVMSKIQLESARQAKEVLLVRRKNLEQQLRSYLELIGPHSGSKVPVASEAFQAIDTGITDEFDETANTAADTTGFTRTTRLEGEADQLVVDITDRRTQQEWNLMWSEFTSVFLPEIGFDFGATVTLDVDNATRAMGQFIYHGIQRLNEEDMGQRDLKYTAAQRRERLRGWRMAANALGHDLMELDAAVAVQNKLIEYNSAEITLQESNLASTVEIEAFQRTRTTNADFYAWMHRAVGDVYYQTYNVAYDLAKKAERAYLFEKGLSRDGNDASAVLKPIIESYWDATNNGLLAGERLLAGLHKLEETFAETRGFDFDVVKRLSLKKLAPDALAALQRGEHVATFGVPEDVFDRDFPGHFRRRIKTISVTIRRRAPSGEEEEEEDGDLAATLTLTEHKTRVSTSLEGGYAEQDGSGADLRFRREATQINSIAVSDADNGGMDDAGKRSAVFLERLIFGEEGGYLPFEGAGAVSSWQLEISEHTGYLLERIEDVVIRMRYTASRGGPLFKAAVKEALGSGSK